MKKITFKVSLLALTGLFALTANAQQKPVGSKKFGRPFTTASNYCGTVENEAILKEKDAKRATTQEFEQWIAPKVAEIKRKLLQKNGQGANETVTLPVVFHIIHNGDAIGENENLSENQILSQITVLNQDYRRTPGTPGFNDNPVGADMEIEFCLAKRTPNGLPTDGIIRYNVGDDNGWVREEVELFKAQTQWDPNKYLNIWVFEDIYIPGGYLAGYAQFPGGSGLDGITQDMLGVANTDGVALGARFVGSIDLDPDGLHDEVRNMGRTASHEIGHFLGLRHIWGDSNSCATATDYCDDTPTSLQANEGCQTNLDSCPDDQGNDMIENYMDYTDDNCLNTFTADQKLRMQAVLANSPRRQTLPTSNSCTLGTASLNNDGAIYLLPFDTNCDNFIAPVLSFRNAGTNTLNTATISYKVDNAAPTTYTWNGTLVPGEDARIELPTTSVSAGEHTFTATLQTVNGSADALSSNNTRTNDFAYVPTESHDIESVTVTIQTDEFASEIIWLLSDSNEQIVGFGAMYENNPEGVLDIQNIELDNNACYNFAIIDQGFDGMPGGYYSIVANTGEVIFEGSGDDLEFYDETSFGVNVVLGTKNHQKSGKGIVLYPNPANSILNIATTDGNIPESYTIYNNLGQVMDNGNITSAIQPLNIAGYANGVYFVKITKGVDSNTLQFIKH
ncbi:M43 family zinc metalloprotease [Flavobacterium hauense]